MRVSDTTSCGIARSAEHIRPLLLIGLALVAGDALAQQAAPVPVPDLTQPLTAPEKMTVGQRPHPEYDPTTIRLGSFDIISSIDLGERFDSNIYGSSVEPLSDFIAFARPTINVSSDWGNDDALGFYASGDVEKYAEHTTENVNNVVVEADGRLGMMSGEYLELRSGYQIEHESRYAADSEAAVEYSGGGYFARYPTQYSVAQSMVSYVHSRGIIGVAVDAGIQSYSFMNEPTFNGGLAINSDRDRNDYSLVPRLSYELAPGYQAFVQTSVARNQYDSTVDATPEHLKRSSTSYAIAAGSQFELARLLVGDFYVGYIADNYEDSRLTSVHGPYFSGSLLWNVTSLTSATFKVKRSIYETILIGSPGTWQTEVDALVEHELLRALLVTAQVSYRYSEYIDLARRDDLIGVSAGLRWKLSRLVSWGIQGSWQQRSSNQPENGFNEGTASADIRLMF